MALLLLLFRFTDLGLRMRASAFNQEVARLLGVRVGRMLTLGWALASLVGSLAGLLIAGGSLVHPGYMDSVVVYGFVAAVLGGLDSPAGAVVGGLLLGVSLSFVSGYVGSQLVALAALGDPDGGAVPAPRRACSPRPGSGGSDARRARTLSRPPSPGPAARRAGASSSWCSRVVDDFRAVQLTQMAYLGIAAGGLTVLTGLNGQISLGHGALMAIGAYTDRAAAARTTTRCCRCSWRSLVATAGHPRGRRARSGPRAARLHGPYLAGATLALAVALPGHRAVLRRHPRRRAGAAGAGARDARPGSSTGVLRHRATTSPASTVRRLPGLADAGRRLPAARQPRSRSRVGRRWRAVRDDEVAAELAGIHLGRARVSAFVVSAAAAGVAGAVMALAVRLAAPSAASRSPSASPCSPRSSSAASAA